MGDLERNVLLVFADEGRIADAVPAEVEALDSELELVIEADFDEALRLIASRGQELRAVVVARALRSPENGQITNLAQEQGGVRAHMVPTLASIPDEGLPSILRSHIASALGIPQGNSGEWEGDGVPVEFACGFAGGGGYVAESKAVDGPGMDLDACSDYGRGLTNS